MIPQRPAGQLSISFLRNEVVSPRATGPRNPRGGLTAEGWTPVAHQLTSVRGALHGDFEKTSCLLSADHFGEVEQRPGPGIRRNPVPSGWMMYTLSSCTCSHPEPLTCPFLSVLRPEVNAMHFPSGDHAGLKKPSGFIGSPCIPGCPVRLRIRFVFGSRIQISALCVSPAETKAACESSGECTP